MTPVGGDPGGCSQAGGALLRLASALEAAGARVEATWAVPEPSATRWVGSAARRASDLQRQLQAGTGETATALARVGRALQEHASDLAAATATTRSLEERAERAGLQVVDGRVVPAWGVIGLADQRASAEREDERRRLQADLDQALLQLGRRRARLGALLEAERAVLAAAATSLRH